MKILFRILLTSVIMASGLLIPSQAFASKYSPEGIYDPEIYYLDNGMRVILNQRHGARNVAIRLNVGVGNHDFTCEKQETAHFLEHMLFTGTSKHSENELDELITKHGGDWNAITHNESTVYEIDIYSENSDVGINSLSEIISDTVMTLSNASATRTIVYRELGGKPSKIRQLLYKHEIISSANHKSYKALFKGNRTYCNNMDTLEHITYLEIIDAYNYYYVPNNMTLVVVGDFEVATMKNQIQQVFGKLKEKNFVRNIPIAQDYEDGPAYFSSSFKPVIGESSTTGLSYRTSGYDSPDYYVLLVIEEYLQNRLFANIRVDHGLTYTPVAEVVGNSKDGILRLSAETTTTSMGTVTSLMLNEVYQLREGVVSDEEISEAIRSLLLKSAQGLESNSSIADFYIDNLNEVDNAGEFVDQEEFIENITAQEFRAVVDRYLIDSNMAFLEAKPTFTYNQFYLILGITIISILFLIWRIGKSLAGRKKHAYSR